MLPPRAALVLALGLTGCGGPGAPPSPPTPTPTPHLLAAGTPLTFVSGETSDPVPAASVTVAGKGYNTDSAGRLITADPYDQGALLDVDADGFLGRQTLLRSASETRFTLWPRSSPTGMNENMTRELVYSPTPCCPSEKPGTLGLERVGDDPLTVVVSDDYKRFARDLGPLREAIAVASDASAGRVRFRIADAAAGASVQVVVGPDPAHRPNIAAFTRTQADGRGFVIGGVITLVVTDLARSVALLSHELGHILGLGHSSVAGMMQAFTNTNYGLFYAYFDRHHRFSPAERLMLRLMYQRRPLSRFPDNDRTAIASSPQGRVFVCQADGPPS